MMNPAMLGSLQWTGQAILASHPGLLQAPLSVYHVLLGVVEKVGEYWDLTDVTLGEVSILLLRLCSLQLTMLSWPSPATA